jgi:hypothetical protein
VIDGLGALETRVSGCGLAELRLRRRAVGPQLRTHDRVAHLAAGVDPPVHLADVVEPDDLVEDDAQLAVGDELQQVRHVLGALR